jgi:hypothetical protein
MDVLLRDCSSGITLEKKGVLGPEVVLTFVSQVSLLPQFRVSRMEGATHQDLWEGAAHIERLP